MTSATARVGVGTLRAARRYGRSKLANVLFAAELARRLTAAGRAATSNSVHPGAIPKSGFGRSLPGPLTRLLGASSALPGIDSVADGAAALLFLAVSPRTEGISGRYVAGRTPALPSAAARDPEAAERLWRRSADLLGIEVPLAEHGRGR
jgi:NAD(P)-dependent dehydrogenase (short-subunit alcohol dehydrogenase family)